MPSRRFAPWTDVASKTGKRGEPVNRYKKNVEEAVKMPVNESLVETEEATKNAKLSSYVSKFLFGFTGLRR